MQPQEIVALLARQQLFPPETLTIAITAECNLNCAHCWVDASPTSLLTWVAPHSVQRVMEQFAALGGTSIRFTGGEPLLHPDWLELLSSAGAAGLKVLLQTNGILFSDSNVSALRDLELAKLEIQISLDGATPATHDLVRGAGAYGQALLGIRRLIAAGLGQNISLFFTEMEHNLFELPELLLLAEELGVGSVSSGTLVRCGRAAEDKGIAPPNPEQYLPLLQRYADDPAFSRCYDKLGSVAALEWCRSEGSGAACSFAKNPYLTANGTLYPCLLCHADEYSVADTFSKGFFAAVIEAIPRWSALQKISQQRVSAIPECQTCALFSSCAGGCMGRAWGSFGQLLVAEDRCQQRQAVLRWKEKS